MLLSLNAPVHCASEPCGRIVAAIINPPQQIVTHLVVRTLSRPFCERLVPIELVSHSDNKSIALNCAPTTFNQLPRLEAAEEEWVYVTVGFDAVDNARLQIDRPLWPIQVKLPSRHLPLHSLTVQPRTEIKAENGRIGTLIQLIIHPHSHAITHLVMQRGYYWNRKQLLIPAEHIETIKDYEIRLSLSKRMTAMLFSLPTSPIPARRQRASSF